MKVKWHKILANKVKDSDVTTSRDYDAIMGSLQTGKPDAAKQETSDDWRLPHSTLPC